MARVLVFAELGELAGGRRHDVPGDTVAEVVAAACDRFGPRFAEVAARAAVVVDGEVVARPALARCPAGPGTEVGLLPPVSGGCDGPGPAGAPLAGARP